MYNFPISPAAGTLYAPAGGPSWRFLDGAWQQETEIDPPLIGAAYYDTVAQATASTISGSLNAIQVLGYYTAGDGGGALYKKVGSQPSHAGKIHSADGAWWELAESTVTPQMFGMKTDGSDIYTPLHDLVGFINLRNGGHVVFPAGTYTMVSNTLAASGKSAPLWTGCDGLAIEGHGAKIDLKGNFQRTVSGDRVIMPFQMFDCKRVRISGFEVDGNVDEMTRLPADLAEISTSLVQLHGCEQVELENLWLHHCQTDGISLRESGTAPCRDVVIRDCRVLNNARQGLSILQCVGFRDYGSEFSGTGDVGGSYGSHSPGAGVDIEPNNYCVTWVSGEYPIIGNERANGGKRYRISAMTNRNVATTVAPVHASGTIAGADGISWDWIDDVGANIAALTGDIVLYGSEIRNNASAFISDNAGRVSAGRIALIDCNTENTRNTTYHFILGLPNVVVQGGYHNIGTGILYPSGIGGVGAHAILRDCVVHGAGVSSIRAAYASNDLTIDNVDLVCGRSTPLTGTPYWPGIVETPYRQERHQIRNFRLFMPAVTYGGSGSAYRAGIVDNSDVYEATFRTDLVVVTADHFWESFGATSRVHSARFIGSVPGVADSFRPGNTVAFDTANIYTTVAQLPYMQTVATDASFTLTPLVSPFLTRHTGALTVARTITLTVTGATKGMTFRITRTGTGAFNLNVGTGPLKALAINQWCEVAFDGSAWFLSAYGAL